MPRGGFSGSLRSPKIDVAIDMGNPFLNRTVDGFLKIGAVGACKVAAEETFDCLHRGDVSKHRVEHAFLKVDRDLLDILETQAMTYEYRGSLVAVLIQCTVISGILCYWKR